VAPRRTHLTDDDSRGNGADTPERKDQAQQLGAPVQVVLDEERQQDVGRPRE
jgi:hypothetical protein